MNAGGCGGLLAVGNDAAAALSCAGRGAMRLASWRVRWTTSGLCGRKHSMRELPREQKEMHRRKLRLEKGVGGVDLFHLVTLFVLT